MVRASAIAVFIGVVASSAAAQVPYTVLHRFTFSPAGLPFRPSAPPIEANDGNFYSTSVYGGTFDRGTVFRVSPDGAVAILYSFTGLLDGLYLLAARAQASDGHLYGTTSSGGAFNAGVVFRLALDGTFTVMHAFAGGSDGASPYGG